MKKRTIIVISVIVVAVIAAVVYYKRHSKPVPITTVAVAKGDITAKITAVGSIVPLKTATVKSPISGSVESLFHDEGDYVKKGEPLLKVNPQPTPSDYASKKQKVLMDLAQERKDELDLKRYEYLLNEGIISENYQPYDEAKRAYKSSREQRILDEQLLSLIEHGKAVINGKEIGNVIVSPTDGFVVERDVNVGDPVVSQGDFQPGNPLMIIADMNDLVFEGQVSETDAAKLHADMPALITIAAFPNEIIKGTINKLALQSAQIAAINNPTSSAAKSTSPFNVGFKVQIGKLNLPTTIKLRSGYSATADIIVAKVAQVIMIPERVLQFENEKNFVWVMGADGKPYKQNIKIGLSDSINVQVLEGLKEGDKVLEVPPPEDKK